MVNIKGLYFKLNMNKQTDKDIYNFFNQEAKHCTKIDILYAAMVAYKELRMQTRLTGGDKQ